MKYISFRIISGIILLAAVLGIGLLAYNAGVTHGQAIIAAAPAIQNNPQSAPVYGLPYWGFFPFFGFGFFGFFALIFLGFVVLGAIRRILWGPHYGWHRWYGRYGHWDDQGSDSGIPPMMAEMHRRMHEAEEQKPGDPSAQK